MLLMYIILLLHLLAAFHTSSVRRITTQVRQLSLQIQGYSPVQTDDYVAISIKAEPGYIVKFEPFASADRVHHMLLYGCDQPAYNREFWRGGATCGGSTHILYAWARNAPPLSLPDNVAFPIGNEGDPVQYLVLQIHYAKQFEGNVMDFSGVTLHLSDNRPKYVAAVYLFVSSQPIPPRQSASLNNMSCSYNSETVLHPFAFRTHTHAMGRVVSAYVKHAADGIWQQIGKRNPQWPQLFQASPPNVVIKKGDFMAATCRFDSSDKDTITPMGSMGVDEMCNFYMMFYRDVDATDPFPYGAGCGMNEDSNLVAREYPIEGTSLLPSHPEWEHMAHQSKKPFGVVEKEKIKKIGDEKLGQVSGLAFDNTENIVVFHRGTRIWDYSTFTRENVLQDQTPISAPTILVAKVGGSKDKIQLVAKYGKNLFFMPHSLFVDESNYYYTTDVGSHQVIKWQIQNGELKSVWELGKKFMPGSDEKHFCKPAGVAVSRSDGSVYVADGYCNNRVMKFSKDGHFLMEWGHASQQREGSFNMGLGYFFLPHDISLDESDSKVYVADRENGRVQVFNDQGDPMFEVRNPKLYPTVYSAHFCHEHGLLFIPGSISHNGQTSLTDHTNKQEINAYVVHQNSTKIQFAFRPKSDQFRRPHIIRAKGNNVYVGEIDETGGILWRLEIQAEKADTAVLKMSETMDLPYNPFFFELSGSSTTIVEKKAFQKIVEENWVTSLLVILLLVSGSYLLCYCFCKKCCGCSKNKSPQDDIDRTGFKPLKTLEAEDYSDPDSDEDFASPITKINLNKN